MSLHPNFFIFLELILFFEIYLEMKKNFKIIWRCKGVKGKNRIGTTRKKLFLIFLNQFIFLNYKI